MNVADGKCGLARVVLESRAFLELSRDEYAALIAARKLISEALAFEEKFDLLVSNYLELETTLNDIATSHMIRSEYGYQALQDCRVRINIRVQNLLSASRLYLDHGAHHAGVFEDAVPNLRGDFAAWTNLHWDESSAYRVCEALRNHSQHRGFPIRSYSTGGQWVDREDGSSVMLHSVEIFLDFDDLREAGRTKASTLADIEAHGLKTDARPLFREYVERIGTIHEAMREKLNDALLGAESAIKAAMQRFQEAFPNEKSMIGLAAVEHDAAGRRSKQTDLFMDLIDRRRMFIERNSSLVNLPKRHVSSEPVPKRKNRRPQQ